MLQIFTSYSFLSKVFSALSWMASPLLSIWKNQCRTHSQPPGSVDIWDNIFSWKYTLWKYMFTNTLLKIHIAKLSGSRIKNWVALTLLVVRPALVTSSLIWYRLIWPDLMYIPQILTLTPILGHSPTPGGASGAKILKWPCRFFFGRMGMGSLELLSYFWSLNTILVVKTLMDYPRPLPMLWS